MSKWISFRIIAENHIRQLRRWFRVEVVDEGAALSVLPIASALPESVIFMHPFFYPMQTYGKKIIAKFGSIKRLVGVDVADSDSITEYAVSVANLASAIIVPSSFSRNAYVKSGVKVPVYVVPHGVDEEWFTTRVSVNFFKPLLDFKAKHNLKLIQTWLLHSSYRKGEDIVYKVFNELVKERKDAALVVKRPLTLDVYVDGVDEAQPKPTYSLPASWLSDDQIRELMDVCDIFLLGSRGGGFEHPPLLALARGEVALGAKGGAWEDYLPDWALVSSHASDIVLKDNPIHNGRGVEMDVDACASKLHTILDNLDEYRARVRQHVYTVVRERFTWGRIGEQLRDIVFNVRGV